MTLLYNLIMAAVDLAALYLAWRKPGLLRWFEVMLGAGVVALGLACLLGGLFEDHFGVLRLVCYGVFAHGVAVLLASIVLLWRTSRLAAAGCFLLAAGLSAAAYDAFLVEPTWPEMLEVSHVQITSEKITRRLKIVVIADLQTDQIGDYQREVFRLAMGEKPDVILLAGDYLQAPPEEMAGLCRELNRFLREIGFGAPGGVFAVRGNVDDDDWARLFEGLPVRCFEETTRPPIELEQLRLTCLRLGDSYRTHLEINNPKPERFHLVLGHSPNFARGRIEADLLVAGHTHGGQVRFPWIGPLITHARVPPAWAAGLTELPSGAQLLVSRGIGMERHHAPRMRFLCRPELVVIELVPAAREQGGQRRD